jgi:hypothetical protein
MVGKPEGNRQLARPRHKWVDVLSWILWRQNGVVWTGFFWLRIGTNEEFL